MRDAWWVVLLSLFVKFRSKSSPGSCSHPWCWQQSSLGDSTMEEPLHRHNVLPCYV